MERMGHVIRLKPAALDEYRRLHAAVWPEILEIILACNIANYSIFLYEPEMLMFAYWDYVGADFAADMAKLRAEPPHGRVVGDHRPDAGADAPSRSGRMVGPDGERLLLPLNVQKKMSSRSSRAATLSCARDSTPRTRSWMSRSLCIV